MPYKSAFVINLSDINRQFSFFSKSLYTWTSANYLAFRYQFFREETVNH